MDLEALHSIGYGVYIIGSNKGDKLNGQAANAVMQITSDPPTVVISINKNNLTHEYITASGVFSVASLCEHSTLSYIGTFGFKSGRDVDKLEGISYHIGKTGAPVITEYAVACFEARVIQTVDVNTHTLFVGEVVDAEMISDEVCMTYNHYHMVKRGTTPSTAPTFIVKEAKEKK